MGMDGFFEAKSLVLPRVEVHLHLGRITFRFGSLKPWDNGNEKLYPNASCPYIYHATPKPGFLGGQNLYFFMVLGAHGIY